MIISDIKYLSDDLLNISKDFIDIMTKFMIFVIKEAINLSNTCSSSVPQVHTGLSVIAKVLRPFPLCPGLMQ